jgi:hypothetical protein
MLIKAVLVFLAAMVVVAMIGNALFPGSIGRVVRKTIPKASRCSRCGRYLIGKSGCDCGKKG